MALWYDVIVGYSTASCIPGLSANKKKMVAAEAEFFFYSV